jgi:hypothetical protein
MTLLRFRQRGEVLRAVGFGVDLQGDTPVVVRAERARGRLHYTPLPGDDPGFRKALERGAPVAGLLFARESFARWIEAPFSSRGKARRVLPTLLDIELPFALEDCIYGFLALQRTARKTVRALAVAARLDTVSRKLAALGAQGVDPAILDQECLALWTQSLREVPPARGARPDWRVVVYLGLERCTVVLGRGAEFVTAHSLPAHDPAQLARVLAAHLPAEAAVVAWCWGGPGAADPARVADLHERLGAQWPGPSTVHEDPRTFLARAAAARAVAPGPLSCNLREGAFAHPRVIRRLQRRRLQTASAALAGAALLGGLSLALLRGLAAERARLEGDFRARTQSLAGRDIGGAKGAQALRIVDEAVRQRKARLHPFVRAFDAPLTGVLASVLTVGRERGLYYETVSLGSAQVLIRGVARDWRRCEGLAAHLRQAGYRVQVDRQESTRDEWMLFTIRSGDGDEGN